MPTYEYACTECGEQLEVVQSFKDEALTECPNCKGRLRKIFGNVGVTFKGSGFYKTDSRGKTNEKSTDSKPAESKPAESKPAESKPASSDTKPATTSPSSDSKTS